MTSATLSLNGQIYHHTDLRGALGEDLHRLPWLMRVLIENVIRRGGAEEGAAAIAAAREWLRTGDSTHEIAFRPGRLLMHDTTCIPALVDIAAMRDVLAREGIDPARLSPGLRVDVSVDHSVAVDSFARPDALARNMAREVERNAERYRMMKWAGAALDNFHVHPPGTGIMHTLNLEQLASVIAQERRGEADWLVPDTLLGTDSHTPMINGIGVLAWGIGGLEAESVMFGMPAMLRLPQVIGVRLTGTVREGVLATDLALAVTEALRARDPKGAFVEFFGPGVSALSAGDRAVIANMTPEFGAGTGFFPVDERTLDYLRQTGRERADVARARAGAQALGLWFDPNASPHYSEIIEIDLGAIGPSLAGPRRPQDRIRPDHAARALAEAFRPLAPRQGDEIPDGAVAIAAITSCTNTSDPRLLIAAGLLARKARAAGLRPAAWVKTSLAPGSPAAARYLTRAGLLDDLEALGFGIVGFGCTTCIGNSGPLPDQMARAIDGGTLAVAVLSGNRNFPGRVHPDLQAGFLASPPMVIAAALAGDLNRDLTRDPLGTGKDGAPVTLADLWPGSDDIDAALSAALRPDDVKGAFAEAGDSAAWAALDAPATPTFPWSAGSSYLRPPPFALDPPPTRLGRYTARALMVLGDDMTTDHISPAGQIPAESEAGRYLTEQGENPADLNVYAARRGNWQVMLRGLFANRDARNLLAPDCPPATTPGPGGAGCIPLPDAAAALADAGQPLVIVAGERFGMGSSRDWAAKGQALLGVRAVLALGFERIHRANLIAMGILPLRLPANAQPEALNISPADRFEIDAASDSLAPGSAVPVVLQRADGGEMRLDCVAEIATRQEIRQLTAGGIIPLILSRARAAQE